MRTDSLRISKQPHYQCQFFEANKKTKILWARNSQHNSK